MNFFEQNGIPWRMSEEMGYTVHDKGNLCRCAKQITAHSSLVQKILRENKLDGDIKWLGFCELKYWINSCFDTREKMISSQASGTNMQWRLRSMIEWAVLPLLSTNASQKNSFSTIGVCPTERTHNFRNLSHFSSRKYTHQSPLFVMKREFGWSILKIASSPSLFWAVWWSKTKDSRSRDWWMIPWLPLATMLPQHHFTLLDATRKVDCVREFAASLGSRMSHHSGEESKIWLLPRWKKRENNKNGIVFLDGTPSTSDHYDLVVTRAAAYIEDPLPG